MKRWIRTNLAVLLLTVLLLTVTVISAYIGLGKKPNTPHAPSSVSSEKVSLEGLRDAKALEAFVNVIFAESMENRFQEH